MNGHFWYAFLFVIVVVLFFLREWRSSLIIILTIPFSLITAFITMYSIGYTINIFSLMALVIAIGMVVDNAIVVLENITRHIENGSRPKQAAMFAASEMGMAIMASTITSLPLLAFVKEEYNRAIHDQTISETTTPTSSVSSISLGNFFKKELLLQKNSGA